MSVDKMKKRNARLMKMVEDEREKVAGYKQITQLYGAYIAILLEKMGATKEKPVTIEMAEAKEAMARIETRAMPSEEGWKLYCDIINE